jgi:hypothetical protein
VILRSKSRRGVASIIGGVFLILIILSAYAFFVMSNQTTNDLQSTIRAMNTFDDDKKQENIKFNNVVSDGTNLIISISNQGSKMVNITYIAWLNTEKQNANYNITTPLVYIHDQAVYGLVINPGNFTIYNLNVKCTDCSYKIKAISDRGNIITASYPFVSPSTTSISLLQNFKHYNEPSTVIISGSGFTVNSNIDIKFDDVIVGSSITDASGSFSTTFSVSSTESIGAHNVKAIDSNFFFASATFTVIT